LHEKQVGFVSLQESIDTTTSGGKLVFHIFGALAEFERELIRERTNAGLASARRRGRMGGRPKAVSSRQIQIAKTMLQDPKTTIKEVCQTLQISKTTLYRYLKK
jgi:DNA invertase Pin-like site-specific DNA recombinase